LSITGIAKAFFTAVRFSFERSFSSAMRISWLVPSFGESTTILPSVKAFPAKPLLFFILIEPTENCPTYAGLSDSCNPIEYRWSMSLCCMNRITLLALRTLAMVVARSEASGTKKQLWDWLASPLKYFTSSSNSLLMLYFISWAINPEAVSSATC